jgi:hypothetical protein
MLSEWLMVHDGDFAHHRLKPSMEGTLVDIVVTEFDMLDGDDLPTQLTPINNERLPFANLGLEFFNLRKLTLSELQSLDDAENTLQALNRRIGALGTRKAFDGRNARGEFGVPGEV